MAFGLDFIRKLKPCNWRYKEPLDDGKIHFGFIAQDVDKLASYKKFGFVVKRGEYLHLAMTEFIGPLVKAVQELSDKVEALEERIKLLEK